MALIEEDITRLHKILKKAQIKKKEETAEPRGLKDDVRLRKHQKEGLTWLIWRECQDPSGGILADDMGIGKTLMIISLIVHQKENEKDYKFKTGKKIPSNATLVIAKKTILGHWEGEIKKFTKEDVLKTHVYSSDSKARLSDSNKLAEFDVVITNLEYIRNGSALDHIAWRRVVIDEAHSIKNRNTIGSKFVCTLNAKSRWCLTGTPVHNVHWDLYSLVRFLRVPKFDTEAIWSTLANETKVRQVDDLTDMQACRIRLLNECIMLRRLKSDADDSTGQQIVVLPPKKEEMIDIRLKGLERAAYEIMLEHNISKLKEMYVDSKDPKSSKSTPSKSKKPLEAPTMDTPKKDTKKGISCILELLTRQRQACNHFALTSQVIGPDPDDSINGLKDNKFVDIFKPTYKSTKLQELFDRVDFAVHVREDKCVILSDWAKMLEIIEFHLKQAKIKYAKITGETKGATRTDIVDAFNDKNNKDIQVLLLTLRVGDVGLNLVGGNHLFIFEMPWNPAVEQQANDRIYRIGQEKDVFMYKFIVQDTVEHKILEVQKRKLNLAESIIGGKVVKEPKYTKEQMLEIFGLKLL